LLACSLLELTTTTNKINDDDNNNNNNKQKKQVGKASDIYVMCLSKDLEVCAGNVVVCIVSTKVDNLSGADPLSELQPGIALLGDIKERFDSCVDTFEPVAGGLEDRCFISKSYDDSSHFKVLEGRRRGGDANHTDDDD
jgi:RAB protein geranylgeranyltransferase component A